ncbi:phytanoyl-CoA dioxygenase family protein [Fusarium austroafricanum]|uniref:Phytanoyl-CoA dioxygenase family protein n=1 Tax=Fusarium austroafricanum TaxID=2364996 RepID=A0A8H4P3F2_9HYPO|nr:phytanoyl-CoA dioxygenase family protein [Fusarium austroafricanum]
MALVDNRLSLENLEDPWSAFLQPTNLAESKRDAITAVIAEESEKLRETWHKFQQFNKPEDRLDLNTTNPTMESIAKLVGQGMQNWNDKRKSGRQGTVSRKFHKFCNAIDSHKSLMKVLPESHEYFSMFMGSTTAVVQASVNHEAVIESLAEALEEMTDLVKDSERDWMLFSSDEMTSRVVDLYIGIFQFLNHAMEWMMRSRSKRAADAFNENLAKLFQNDISEVKSKFERIRLLATQSGLADGRITRHHVEGISSGVDSLREDNVRMEHMMKEMKESYKQLAQLCQQQLLIPQAQAFINDQRLLAEAEQRRRSWQSAASSIFSIEDVTEEKPAHITDRVNLDEAIQKLEKFFDTQRVKLSPQGFRLDLITPQMAQRLIGWLQGDVEGTLLLWLQGPTTLSEDQENPMSMLAAKFIQMSGEVKVRNEKPIPLISYFSNISHKKPRDGNGSREAQGTVALVYALLQQLLIDINLSPITHTRGQDALNQIQHKVFELDGTTRTWDQALCALTTAVELSVPGMLCVVDGMHWLDSKETEKLLRELIQCLRKTGFKVLFTTSARCAALSKEISREEYVHVDEP